MSKKKPTKAQWSQESLKTAFEMVKEGKKIRQAARLTGIPFSTLQERLKKNDLGIPQLGRHTIFTKEQEEGMASQIRLLANIFYGCTAMELRKMAFKYAECNGIKHNFSKNLQAAGKEWLDAFLKRNSLSVRKAEGTSLNRAFAFNREEVGRFFDLLGDLMEKYKFPPRNIYNVDETGVTSVQEPGKVVAAKGQKRVGSITSGERGQNVTAVCAMSATGQFIPPMLIYPRQRHSTALEKDGPREALYKNSKNGWINEELFVVWLNHFIKFSKPTETDPVLLILDNHSSHTSWNAYKFCKENHIIMLSLPPHGSHRIQPMDVSIYGPFKTAYKQECNIFMKCHMGRKITQNDIASLFKKAFVRVATITNAESGFAATGIYPYNPHIFTDEDFLAAEINSKNADEEIYCNRTQESPSLLDDAESYAVQTSAGPQHTDAISPPENSPSTSYIVPTLSPMPRLDCNISGPSTSSDNLIVAKQASAISPSLDCTSTSLTSFSMSATTSFSLLPSLGSNISAPSAVSPASVNPVSNYDGKNLVSASLSDGLDAAMNAPTYLLPMLECNMSPCKITPTTPVKTLLHSDCSFLIPKSLSDGPDVVLPAPAIHNQPPRYEPAFSTLQSKSEFNNLTISTMEASYIEMRNVTPPLIQEESKDFKAINYYLNEYPIPSTSRASLIVSNIEKVTVKDLLPIPKKTEKRNKETSRKQHATVLTATPNKIILFAKEQKKLAKLEKENKKKGVTKDNTNVKKGKTQKQLQRKHNNEIDIDEYLEKEIKNKKTKQIEKSKKNTKLIVVKKKILTSKSSENKILESKTEKRQIRQDSETDIGEDTENEFDSKETKEKKYKNILTGNKRKNTIKTERVKRVKRKVLQNESSDVGSTSNSDIEMVDLREDDDTDLDDDSENKCIICNDYGRNNELWYRCVRCGRWAHSECSGCDSPRNYICDLCFN